MSRQEARRRLQAADPNLTIVSGRRRKNAKESSTQSLLPRVLSPAEAKAWGLPEMIPLFPSEEVLDIEAKWSKDDLKTLAMQYSLESSGSKALLIQKLLYVGAMDESGELTGLPVEETGELMQVPYVISAPKKFCCRLCGACAPEHLLKRGRFFERIAWLRDHYKMAHPGKWGKGGRSVPDVQGKAYLYHGIAYRHNGQILESDDFEHLPTMEMLRQWAILLAQKEFGTERGGFGPGVKMNVGKIIVTGPEGYRAEWSKWDLFP